MARLVVIGGGAAGMSAASAARQAGRSGPLCSDTLIVAAGAGYI